MREPGFRPIAHAGRSPRPGPDGRPGSAGSCSKRSRCPSFNLQLGNLRLHPPHAFQRFYELRVRISHLSSSCQKTEDKCQGEGFHRSSTRIGGGVKGSDGRCHAALKCRKCTLSVVTSKKGILCTLNDMLAKSRARCQRTKRNRMQLRVS
jgi:hypothetical protein